MTNKNTVGLIVVTTILAGLSLFINVIYGLIKLKILTDEVKREMRARGLPVFQTSFPDIFAYNYFKSFEKFVRENPDMFTREYADIYGDAVERAYTNMLLHFVAIPMIWIIALLITVGVTGGL